MTFWLQRFRKLDVTQESHRKMLVDTFVNAVYVYDDRLLLTYNFKEGGQTISLADVKAAEKVKSGSDLDCLAARRKPRTLPASGSTFGAFAVIKKRQTAKTAWRSSRVGYFFCVSFFRNARMESGSKPFVGSFGWGICSAVCFVSVVVAVFVAGMAATSLFVQVE